MADLKTAYDAAMKWAEAQERYLAEQGIENPTAIGANIQHHFGPLCAAPSSSAGLDVERLNRAILACIEAASSRKAWEDLSINEQSTAILAALSPATEEPRDG